jgi:hypothetical protein
LAFSVFDIIYQAVIMTASGISDISKAKRYAML